MVWDRIAVDRIAVSRAAEHRGDCDCSRERPAGEICQVDHKDLEI